jgi:hypothetical protein
MELSGQNHVLTFLSLGKFAGTNLIETWLRLGDGRLRKDKNLLSLPALEPEIFLFVAQALK